MKNLLRVTDFNNDDIVKIFNMAAELEKSPFDKKLKNKTFVLFFPSSSIRTRITFEKGIEALGGQAILFPSEALDKKEDIKDVVSYLENWVDGIIVRHNDFGLLEKMCKYSKVPVINAMTRQNHPCEILSDLYSIKKLRENYLDLNYTFVGGKGNIGMSWVEASETLGISLTQVCPKGHEIEAELSTFRVTDSLDGVIEKSDIVLTDSIPQNKELFLTYKVTAELMSSAKPGALLNPCPPFFRGEEVSSDAIDSRYFVGYEFKKSLLCVQQAIILYCCGMM